MMSIFLFENVWTNKLFLFFSFIIVIIYQTILKTWLCQYFKDFHAYSILKIKSQEQSSSMQKQKTNTYLECHK